MGVVFYADIELRGKRDRGTLDTAGDYGRLLYTLGKFYRAQGVLGAAFRMQKEELGEESFWTGVARKNYGVFLCMAWKDGKGRFMEG